MIFHVLIPSFLTSIPVILFFFFCLSGLNGTRIPQTLVILDLNTLSNQESSHHIYTCVVLPPPPPPPYWASLITLHLLCREQG